MPHVSAMKTVANEADSAVTTTNSGMPKLENPCRFIRAYVDSSQQQKIRAMHPLMHSQNMLLSHRSRIRMLKQLLMQFSKNGSASLEFQLIYILMEEKNLSTG
jgi:hypothetical protein